MVEYSKNTTPLSKLPRNISYYRNYDSGKIAGILAKDFITGNIKIFNIRKYNIKEAFKEAVKYVYPHQYKKVLLKFPSPSIDKNDLHYILNINKTGVFGINLVVNNKNKIDTTSYLTSFATYNPSTKSIINFSIRKYGLEEAWKRAVEFRYSHFDPLPTDDTTLKPEWWDMINPIHKTKTR